MDKNDPENFGGRIIHLIGTAHISRESIVEVTETIRGERPGMVCVELDEGRYSSIKEKSSWEKIDVSKVLREGKGFLLLANIVLAGFQKRMGSGTGVKPGEEMIAAIDTAGELGIPFRLCDREVQVTLRRAWAGCGFLDKCKLLSALVSSMFTGKKIDPAEVENLKKANELDNMMRELAEYLPAVKATLIDERDRYLATRIWDAAGSLALTAPATPAPHIPSPAELGAVAITGSLGLALGAADLGIISIAVPPLSAPAPEPEPARGGSTVAVVGAGHLQGIKAWLEKFAAGTDPGNLAELEVIPPKSALSKVLKWVIPILLVGLAVFIFARNPPDLGLQALLRWVLWNGGFAALGAILALAHPLAVAVAFASAPFTIGNPFVSAGLLAALVQATVRKPRVADAQNISADIETLRGLYRNRISKTLLVFLLANLGSFLGTWPAIGSVAELLAK